MLLTTKLFCMIQNYKITEKKLFFFSEGNSSACASPVPPETPSSLSSPEATEISSLIINNVLEKPPRTFEHVFSQDRVVASVEKNDSTDFQNDLSESGRGSEPIKIQVKEEITSGMLTMNCTIL